ncbi:MAG: hypothetical protein DRJ34_00455, partial [Thermoprotei archaeon]
FIGTFLFLKIDYRRSLFGYRPIEGVNIQNIKPEKLILDGQQRLTSLYYVLYSPDIPLRDTKYPYAFYIDLRKLYEENIEEAIISERKERIKDVLNNVEKQFEKKILPLTILKGYGLWMKWNIQAHDYIRKSGDNEFKRIYPSIMSNININKFLDFEVPVIEIGENVPIEQIAEIFERINTTGVRLSIFDLMTARLRPYNIMLRQLWKKAQENYVYIRKLSDHPINIYVLQTMALINGKSPKRSHLLKLSLDHFIDRWHEAVKYVNKAIERMMNYREGYGVIKSKLLPYVTMIPPLASLLAKVNTMRGDIRQYEKIDIWYWRSVFSARYAGATDSTMYEDYKSVCKWLKNDNEKISFNINLSELNLIEENKKSSAIYKGVMCLISLKGALDFHSGQPPEYSKLNDHHIFPIKFIENSLPQYKDLMHTVLNRTLLSEETNKWIIGKREPREYIRELKIKLGQERLMRILDTHFINEEAYEALKSNDFENFIQARERYILKEINERVKLS